MRLRYARRAGSRSRQRDDTGPGCSAPEPRRRRTWPPSSTGPWCATLDFNDAYRTLDASHPSDNLPGVLAMAEALGASGRDFILALAISYEIQCRFTDDVPFNDAGWDQPVVGAMACALACGRLLGLEPAQLAEAVALASVPFLCTYQTRAGELSMWKGCAGPNGARNGIFAATLAAEGLTGPYHPFEGVFGIWNQTTGRPYEVNLPPPGPMSSCGLMQTNIKTYPVRDSCQLPIDTALDLRAKIDASDIASLHISTYRSAYEGAVKDPELWAPQTRETADHSMPFSVAAALLDGVVTPGTFEEFAVPRRRRAVAHRTDGDRGERRLLAADAGAAQLPDRGHIARRLTGHGAPHAVAGRRSSSVSTMPTSWRSSTSARRPTWTMPAESASSSSHGDSRSRTTSAILWTR